jgi:hypothetical protein
LKSDFVADFFETKRNIAYIFAPTLLLSDSPTGLQTLLHEKRSVACNARVELWGLEKSFVTYPVYFNLIGAK